MENKSAKEIVTLVFKALAVAMGIAVTVLSCMDVIDPKSAVLMLGIGLSCAGIAMLEKR